MTTPPEDPNAYLFKGWPGSKPELGHINKRQFMMTGALIPPFSAFNYRMEPYIKHAQWYDTPEGRQHIIDTKGLYEGHPGLNYLIKKQKLSIIEDGLYASNNWPAPDNSREPPGYNGEGPYLSGPPVP